MSHFIQVYCIIMFCDNGNFWQRARSYICSDLKMSTIAFTFTCLSAFSHSKMRKPARFDDGRFEKSLQHGCMICIVFYSFQKCIMFENTYICVICFNTMSLCFSMDNVIRGSQEAMVLMEPDYWRVLVATSNGQPAGIIQLNLPREQGASWRGGCMRELPRLLGFMQGEIHG